MYPQPCFRSNGNCEPGGRLQPVLMRPTLQLSVKTWGGGSAGGWEGGYWRFGGGGGGGGGGAGGCGGGGYWWFGRGGGGGVPKVGGPVRDPLLPHAYLQRGGGVWGGGGGKEVIM